MKIVTCSGCGAKFDVSRHELGKKVRCGRCKSILTLPASGAESDEAATSPTEAGPASAVEPPRLAAKQMRIITCSSCGAEFDVSRHAPGRKVRCGRCKAVLQVPENGVSGAEASPGTGAEGTPSSPTPQRAETKRAAFDGRSGRLRDARGRTYEVPRSRSSMRVKVAIAAAIIVVALAGVWFGLFDGNGEKTNNEAELAATLRAQYGERYNSIDRANPDQLLDLHDWCNQKPDMFGREAEELLQRLIAIRADHPGGLARVRTLVEKKLAQARQANTEADWVAVAEFCNRFNLKDECANAAEAALKVNRDNARANELLGRVQAPNERGEMVWESKEVVEERETLYRLGPREKFINSLSEKTYGEVFERVPLWEWRKKAKHREAECKEGWLLRDYEPYVIFLEKDSRVDAAVFDRIYELLERLSKEFFSAYLGEEKPATMVEELMAVFIFKNRQSFLRRTGAKQYVGAYFTGEKHALMIPYDANPKERESMIYHEGAHQLVDFVARKSGGGSRPFWFEEGISTNFEALAFGKAGTEPLARVGSIHYLIMAKAAIRAKKHKPFKEMLGMSYADGQVSDTDRGDNYAQSWAMVYFLYNYDKGKYREKWKEYFKAETSGKGGPGVFETIFGDVGVIEKEWEQYILSINP